MHSALKHGIEPAVYLAILKVESNLNQSAYNAKTKDYGAAQVNHKTALRYGLSLERLKRDSRYNLDAGARILADMKRAFPRSYICRYNVGTGNLAGERKLRCTLYLAKVLKKMADE